MPVTVKLAPLLAFGISWGFTWFFTPSVIVAVGATGGVALLNKITDVAPPEPARFPVRLPRKERTIPRAPRERIPSL